MVVNREMGPGAFRTCQTSIRWAPEEIGRIARALPEDMTLSDFIRVCALSRPEDVAQAILEHRREQNGGEGERSSEVA